MTGKGNRPILILAALFVVASFLAWYFSWFGRELSDADISKYLADEKNPRHVQHALLQIQQRMERGDGGAKVWYPQIVTLSGNPETEFRLTVAWLMGFDNSSQEFGYVIERSLNNRVLQKVLRIRVGKEGDAHRYHARADGGK